MLVGDVLAYLDIFSALVLLGLMSRVATVIFTVNQAATCAARSAMIVRANLQRLDRRHRRSRTRTRSIGWAKKGDDEHVVIQGVAWARRGEGFRSLLALGRP